MSNITDSYCTPLYITARLGQFTTDPCSNPRAHIPAVFRYMLETGHDGLTLPWFGRVFLNHPYSNPMPWMLKLHDELGNACTEAVVLPKHDHSTQWWQVLVQPHEGFVCDEWKFNKRIQFDPPPGIKASSNNFCSSVYHWRKPDTARLEIADIATLWVRV